MNLTEEQLKRLEAAETLARGMSYNQWKANMLNSLFETWGRKGEDGRGAAPSDIRPDTVRHGERSGSVGA